MIGENAIENVAFENLKNREKTYRRKNKSYHLAFPAHRNCFLRLLPLKIAGLSPRKIDYLMPWKIDSRLAKTLSLALTVSSWSSSVLMKSSKLTSNFS